MIDTVCLLDPILSGRPLSLQTIISYKSQEKANNLSNHLLPRTGLVWTTNYPSLSKQKMWNKGMTWVTLTKGGCPCYMERKAPVAIPASALCWGTSFAMSTPFASVGHLYRAVEDAAPPLSCPPARTSSPLHYLLSSLIQTQAIDQPSCSSLHYIASALST